MPTPTPIVAPVRTVIQSETCSNLGGADSYCFLPPFTTTQKGDLDAHVDWTFDTDSIQVFLAAGPCTLPLINSGMCNLVKYDVAGKTPKPRTLIVKGLVAGQYELAVRNFGNHVEAISTEIGLTTGG